MDTDLSISGMTCASCVNRVERVLSRVPGVTGVSVNLATERARITTAAPANLEALIKAVEKAGYGASLPKEAPPPDNSELIRVLIAAGLSVPLLLGMVVPALMLPGVRNAVPGWPAPTSSS